MRKGLNPLDSPDRNEWVQRVAPFITVTPMKIYIVFLYQAIVVLK